MGGVCSCRGRDSQVNAGSILDRVISQASNEDQCLLYRLANYKKSGELIESYNLGGQTEVEKLIRDQFGVLMYADGKGQAINRAEYLRWKFRDIEQVVLPIEASLSRFDPLAQWNDHEACWQMQYRGSLGETLLHVLIICDTRTHTRIARILLKCFPQLAIDVVEGEEYLGASALHLAIAYNNNELVQDLVEAGAIISQRAIGSFFLPRDQQRMRPAKTTDYEGLAYLGEYPLAWAACCANESVYNLLLDSGADPDEQDSFGNMILHMVVVCDKLDMFGYALRHPKLPARNGIANAAGLTPLTLACQLGRAEVFREMLELSAREFWRYSNITCSAYPLNALDTLLPDGRTNWNSALFIILNGTKEEHLNMLDGGIIQRLLEEKWKTFARYADLSYTTYPNLAKTVFAIFMVLVPILLLNMLIAMMGNTYAHVIEQSEKEWVKQWAKIVVSLERAVSQKDAQNYLQEYSIKLGPGDDPNNPASEQRGVLVIKCKSKTKAKQRKGAVANWKRVGKVTITELRKRGMTGEELRRIMWGRASFSTPVRVSPTVDQPQVSAVTAGFGGALTTALDMMAFAHDIDLSTATEGIPTNVDAKHAKPKISADEQSAPSNKQEQLAAQPAEEQAAVTASHRQHAPSDFNKKPATPATVQDGDRADASHAIVDEIQDPLLELVIAAENMSDHETLTKIARRAAESVAVPTDPKINLQILEQFTMIKMPEEEPVPVAKKQYFIESSDNDFGGDALLGTEARLRRIRSANNRFITTRRHSRHENGDPSSSSSSTSVDGNPRCPAPLLTDPEQKLTNRQIEGIDGPVRLIKADVKRNGECDSSKNKAQKRRPKTARNRVSPKESEEPAQRRRESIERNKAVSPATSPTDPLEPWSTRDIKDMNTILAWEENLPESP
ncbi:transient receptor potential cation channel subfamily V iav isoform X4 [Megalopta genalis]|uniref:transient receptor potential cation channel subfamily V iav isoform X4 n=1 Tax=Megalopta genalis TaxID=115081 RepID=UPI003FD14AF5